MRTFALVALLVSNFAFAVTNLQSAKCTGNRGTQIDVQVDVLESFPPQSMISITSFEGEKTGFSAFTEYVSLEVNPPIDQWTWTSHNKSQSVVIRSRDGKAGTGYYSIGRMLPENLKCELN